MNKLKVLYDLFTTMKNKETVSGILTVQIHKSDNELFSLRNEFFKNLLTGQTKAKINSNLDCQGNIIKHESTNEFTIPHNGACRTHQFMRHFHQPNDIGCCAGLRGHLSRLTFGLSILNALKVEEQEDKTIAISLIDKDLPEDTKAMICEKVNHACSCHRSHSFMKDLCAVAEPEFAAQIFLTKNYEIEKVIATFVGTQKDESNTPHDLTTRAELSLAW